MGEKTKIGYVHHSLSPWYGCQEVHAGCEHCYARALERSLGVDRTKHRVMAADFHGGCRRLNAKAKKAGERRRLLIQLCDPFEDCDLPVVTHYGDRVYMGWNPPPATLADLRRDTFTTIDACPWLDFLLFTKRPENIIWMWPEKSPGVLRHLRNVWLGISISNQATADKMVFKLLKCRDLVSVLVLSIEPLLGPINLKLATPCDRDCSEYQNAECPGTSELCIMQRLVDWAIVGGESGPQHRPCEVEWIESIVDQCQAANVPVWVKQDCGIYQGKQGRLPDQLWNLKQLPR